MLCEAVSDRAALSVEEDAKKGRREKEEHSQSPRVEGLSPSHKSPGVFLAIPKGLAQTRVGRSLSATHRQRFSKSLMQRLFCLQRGTRKFAPGAARRKTRRSQTQPTLGW